MDIEQLREIRLKAQRAVEDLPDGDLKTAAFNTILAALVNSLLTEITPVRFGWLNRFRDFTVIVTCFSLVIGIIVAFTNIVNSNRQIRFAGLEQAKGVFAREEEMKDTVADFLKNFHTIPSADSLMRKYGSGRAMYYSVELRKFRAVAHHYETVGALIDGGYLDFNLYYRLVAFPDDFYNVTLDLRNFMRDNWNEPHKKLADFLIYFENLHKEYTDERKRTGQ